MRRSGNFIYFNGEADYPRLQHLPFNRNFKVRSSLMKSMNNHGFTSPILVIETDLVIGRKGLYVIDGQHRAATASALNIPFEAKIIGENCKTVADIVHLVAMHNSTQKPWKTEDYVNAYSHLNYPEYITLNSVEQSSPYTVSTIAAMLNGIRSKGHVTDKIQNGTFRCNLLRETKQTLVYAARLSMIGKLTSRMVLALHYVMHETDFNKDFFAKKYRENYNSVIELKLDDFTDIFMSWLHVGEGQIA